jgi:hypothetical protein
MEKPPQKSTPPRLRPEQRRPERRRYAVGLEDLARKLAAPALRRHGFTQDALVARWSDIVGDRFAEVSLPARLSFAPTSRTGGTLSIWIEGPLATQFQHAESLIIERVNQFFGYAAVARLKLMQGPVPPRHVRQRPRLSDQPPPEIVALMPDGPLKLALTQLSATFLVDKQS